jgi:hypothetical protein
LRVRRRAATGGAGSSLHGFIIYFSKEFWAFCQKRKEKLHIGIWRGIGMPSSGF